MLLDSHLPAFDREPQVFPLGAPVLSINHLGSQFATDLCSCVSESRQWSQSVCRLPGLLGKLTSLGWLIFFFKFAVSRNHWLISSALFLLPSSLFLIFITFLKYDSSTEIELTYHASVSFIQTV